MPRGSKNDPTESGVLVYPKLPVPEQRVRNSEPRMPRASSGGGKKVAALLIGGLVAGAAGGFFVRPKLLPDKRIAAAEDAAAEAQKAASTEKDRADGLQRDLGSAEAKQKDLEGQLATAKEAESKLADTAAERDKRSKATDAVKTKLRGAIDKSAGTVTVEGDEVHLAISDKVLFKPNDDALTDRGKAVLARLASALKDIPDHRIAVQGHTDDTPIPPPPAPKKPPKGQPAPPPPVPRFATNWELSAARALTVVHYFQDSAKLEPKKLSALAFGQYRPAANKSASRRIELVLTPIAPAAPRK